MRFVFVFLSIVILTTSCDFTKPRVQSALLEDENHNIITLDSYWYQGKAEVSSYELIQNRYEDLHEGEVILIFVTEDFLTDKQVKNDSYKNPNSTGVLKTNKMKKFTTGIYDYSIMSSVFTPTDRNKFPYTMKVTSSSQDWCGQSFLQLNLDGNSYKSSLYSYFEREADRSEETKSSILEDELMNLIRINPDLLPSGNFDMIPSLEYLRLMHRPFKAIESNGITERYDGEEFEGEDLKIFTVNMVSERRVLEFVFESAAPYKIVGWSVEYPSAFDGKLRRTVARKKGEQYIPYWKFNGLKDTTLRKDLNLWY